MGTFQRLASSGNSSSESWYSSSKSFKVLRFGCQELFRFKVRDADGDKDKLCVDGDDTKEPLLLSLGRSGEVDRDRCGFNECELGGVAPGSNLLLLLLFPFFPPARNLDELLPDGGVGVADRAPFT